METMAVDGLVMIHRASTSPSTGRTRDDPQDLANGRISWSLIKLTGSPSFTGTNVRGEGRDLIVDFAAFGHETGDLLDGVDHRGVVTITELSTDGRVTQVGELTKDVHRNLACSYEGPSPAGTNEIFAAEAVDLRGLVEDQVRGDDQRCVAGNQISENGGGQVDGANLLVETAVGGDPGQGTLEFTNVLGDVLGDEEQDIVRDLDAASSLFRLLAEDG